MNSYIERISFCSLIIFILIISHFETDNSKPMVLASNSLLNYNTENFIDEEESIVHNPPAIDYVINNTENTIQSNSETSPTISVEEKEMNFLVESNAVAVTSITQAHNEINQNSLDKIASGPNNNDQFEEDNTSSIIHNNALAIESPVSKDNSREELTAITKVEEITAQFAKPPPPGGGGEDPFAVPIDDYYGIFLLLGVCIIFGINKLRKLKSLEPNL